MALSPTVRAVRYAVVTGAASGLGRALCLQLAKDSLHVALADINRAGAEETLTLIKQRGGSGQVESLDVADSMAWYHLRCRLEDQWPRLDLLVNNAGVLATGEVGELDLAVADRLVSVNLMGALYGCNEMVPWLKRCASTSGNGHARTFSPAIINVASVFGIYSPPGLAPYNMSKAGVVALSETLYGELRRFGIDVTVVCPAAVPTELFKRASYTDDAYRRLAEEYVRSTSLTADAVAETALAASKRGQLYVVVGRRARSQWRWKRLLPTTFLRVLSRRSYQRVADVKQKAGEL